MSNTDENENAGGEGGDDAVLIPLKKGGNSSVWNFFGFKPDNDTQRVNSVLVHLQHRKVTPQTSTITSDVTINSIMSNEGKTKKQLKILTARPYRPQ